MKTDLSGSIVALLDHFPNAARDLSVEELHNEHPGRWRETTLAAAQMLDPAAVLTDKATLVDALDALQAVIADAESLH